MPRPKKEPTCFNCGEPAHAVVNRLTTRADTRRICMKKECWEVWWNIQVGIVPGAN